MANNFKLSQSGYTYVSKSGHDSNDGLTADNPVRSLISNGSLIIGAGYYEFLSGVIANWQGDGLVIIDCKNQYVSIRPTFTPGGLHNVTIQNARFNEQNSNATRRCYDVTFINCQGCFMGSTNTAFTSKFIDCTFDLLKRDLSASDCIFINTQFVNKKVFFSRNCYVDRNSEVLSSVTPLYSNIQGVIVIPDTLFNDLQSRKYAIQDQLTGTPQDNGYDAGVSWLNAAQLIADGYNATTSTVDSSVATCINRDPLFNNVGINDFTLQSGSPHIGTGQSGVNIGATDVAISILETDHNGNNVEVIKGSEIDDSIPDSLVLNNGETEGAIDFIINIGNTPLTLAGIIEPNAVLEFDSDVAGGTIGNRNVPDSYPLSSQYPDELTATSDGPDTSTVNCTGHGRLVGDVVRISGEDRAIATVPDANSFTVDSPLRGIVLNGTVFQAATSNVLSGLRPNRLTYLMRTSKNTAKPTQDSDWDNDIDPVYSMSGQFLVQEWYQKPNYFIDGGQVYGGGDVDRPDGLAENEIQATWLHIRVFIRNDYNS